MLIKWLISLLRINADRLLDRVSSNFTGDDCSRVREEFVVADHAHDGSYMGMLINPLQIARGGEQP
jgi:hypothetical protein